MSNLELAAFNLLVIIFSAALKGFLSIFPIICTWPEPEVFRVLL